MNGKFAMKNAVTCSFRALPSLLTVLLCAPLLADDPVPPAPAAEVPLVITTEKVGAAPVPTVQVSDDHARWKAASWADAATAEALPANDTLPARAQLKVTTADLGKIAITLPIEGGIDLDLYRRIEVEISSPAANQRPILVTLAGLSGDPPTWFESGPRLVPSKPGLTVAFEPGKAEWKTEHTGWRYSTTPAKRGVQSQLFLLVHGLLSDETVTIVRLRALPYEGAPPAPAADRELPVRPEGPEGPGLEAGRVAGIGHYVRMTLREYAADLRAAGLPEEAQLYELGAP
jgi:hypothetical protein